jgi:hypothetical protein
MKRFWFYHRQVDRIRAEKDIRQLSVLAGATGQEAFEQVHKRLDEQLGQLLVHQPIAPTLIVNTNEPDPDLERDKLDALRANIKRHGR